MVRGQKHCLGGAKLVLGGGEVKKIFRASREFFVTLRVIPLRPPLTKILWPPLHPRKQSCSEEGICSGKYVCEECSHESNSSNKNGLRTNLQQSTERFSGSRNLNVQNQCFEDENLQSQVNYSL